MITRACYGDDDGYCVLATDEAGQVSYIPLAERWAPDSATNSPARADLRAFLVAGGLITAWIPPAVTPAQVKAEARRRILHRYPLWKQINLMRSGGEAAEAAFAWIDTMRATATRLENQDPIPEDFVDDRFWPQ